MKSMMCCTESKVGNIGNAGTVRVRSEAVDPRCICNPVPNPQSPRNQAMLVVQHKQQNKKTNRLAKWSKRISNMSIWW
jgi:hypothetical protein